MCGICGLYGAEPVTPALLRAMTDTLVHRGPDDDGYFIQGGVGLGMRRLSIVDVAGGKQPIMNEDGGVVVVFNGEIYNYGELKNGLAAKGHLFRTQSDTECIVHLYEEYDLDFVHHLRGMFAIALYDHTRQRLVLARDRLGKKPLFYAYSQGSLFFGSEIKPILRACPALRRLNERMVQPFLHFGFIPEPETIYPGIFKLPPGTLLEFTGGEPTIRQYWDLSFVNASTNGHAPRAVAEYEEELDHILREAVRIRLIGEVPLGAFLSGGVDSSLVVAYMSQLMNQPVKTFTIGFDEAGFDDSVDAQRVAEHCQTDHHPLILRVADLRDQFFEVIEQIVRHTDEPFGDSSALPTYWVSKLARQHVTVILGGDGADEAFGGYSLYQGLRFAQLYQRLPGIVRQGVIEPLFDQWVKLAQPGPARWRAELWRKRVNDSNLPLRQMLANKFAIAPQALVNTLVPAAAALLTAKETAGAAWIHLGDGAEAFTQTQYANARFLQLNDFLVKVDRMSMAHSLEARHPFLDHKVVEFAANIPHRLKLRGLETKAILRSVAARHLPAANARKRKHGFEVPLAHWFRTVLYAAVEERLLSSTIIREHLHSGVVQNVLAEHAEGCKDHSQLIWCLLTLDAWHRNYMEDYYAA